MVVALVTWYSTDRRLDRQLAAEAARLDQQLAHARRLDDRQELKQFLDRLADAFEDLHHAYTRQLVVLEHRNEGRSGSALDEMERAAREDTGSGLVLAARLARRSSLRFSSTDPLVASFVDAIGQLKKGDEFIRRTEQDPVARHRDGTVQGQKGLDGYRAFADAVRAIFD